MAISSVVPTRSNRPKGPGNARLGVSQLLALVEANSVLNSSLDLDQLLEIILKVATEKLRADRGTVFLLDRKSGELQARISQGLESRVLRVKLGEGLAGTVASTGQSIRIEDAYRDDRFQQKFDAATGYRTRSVLCTPIRNRTGEIIGVIEMLNKIDGTFTLQDEYFLQALTPHMALALENAMLHAQLVNQERIRTELDLAGQIQQHLLRPPIDPWHCFRISAKAEPCSAVGGDFYDFMPISDTAMWAVIADVSGKGISAAMVMSNLQATMRGLLVGVHSFERLLWQLNNTIRELTGGNKFVTLFLALLHGENRKLQYINAGHNPPVLVRADGRIELLDEGGTPLGLLPTVQVKRAYVALERGDVLVLYTDGLVEAANAADETFGIEGLVRSVKAARPNGGTEAILTRILSDAREFSAGETPTDDQTLVVISVEQ